MARCEAAAAVYNDRIFVCGGTNGEEILDSVEFYDPKTEIWTFFDDMPDYRADHAAVANMNCLTVLGGSCSDEELQATKTVWRMNLDDEGGGWDELKPMEKERSKFSCSLLGGKIYAIGGRNERGFSLKSVEIFDGTSWQRGPDLPVGLDDLSSTTISQKLYKELCDYHERNL